MAIPFEKHLTQGVRAGNTVERVGKTLEAGVCKEAIAAQMRANSKSGTKYTEKDVELLGRLWSDHKSTVLLTKGQAAALSNCATKEIEGGVLALS